MSFRRLAVEQARAGSRDEHADRSRPICEVRQHGCCRDRIAKRDQSETEAQDRTAGHARREPAAHAGTDQQRQCERYHCETCDRRRKNKRILEIERQDRHHDLCRGRVTQHSDGCSGDGRIAEYRQVDHRAWVFAFGKNERHKQDRAHG